MRVVPYQEIILEKLKRQNKLLQMGAEIHANGHAFHYGKISPGCRMCFTGEQGSGIQIGNKCMCECPYCYYENPRGEEPQESINEKLTNWYYSSLDLRNFKPTIFSYQSSGETVAYLDELKKFDVIINDICNRNRINPYKFVYTNGILCNSENLKKMKDMGIEELRFHLSASNFSKQVYKNMELASNMDFRITVEEPSWQLHREKLFEMLPILDSIGGKHLDLVEVQISYYNKKAIAECYKDDKYRAYKDYFYHLYDDGLVYDIMEEVINKKYNFSVMDCSSAVERCRQSKDQPVLFDWNSIDGMCDDWDYGEGFVKTNKQLGILK